MGLHEPGDEEGAVEKLSEFWAELNTDKVYTDWSLGIPEGLLHRSGIYSTAPFKETLENLAEDCAQGFRRKVSVGMTDLNSGEFVTAEENVNPKKMLKYLEAAIAVPGLFPPVIEGNSTYVDGSMLISVDVQGAIEKCREMVNKDEDIILDVIMVQEGNSPLTIVKSPRRHCNSFNRVRTPLGDVSGNDR